MTMSLPILLHWFRGESYCVLQNHNAPTEGLMSVLLMYNFNRMLSNTIQMIVTLRF